MTLHNGSLLKAGMSFYVGKNETSGKRVLAKKGMKFATVDGRTAWVDVPVGDLAAFRGDVCEVLDVCPTYIFTNMGRIVTDVVDVCGDVVVLADPNVSLLAQEVCSAVNRGGGRPLIAVEDTGAPSHLTRCFYTGFAPGARESSHGACPVPGVSGHGRASGAQHVGSWYDGTAPRSPGRGPRVWRGNRARPDVL